MSIGKNKKVIGLRKDELGGKIMTKFVGIRKKTYRYLVDNSSEETKSTKKQKAQKMCRKRRFKLENYKNCLEATQLKNEINCFENNKFNIDSLKKS